MALITGGAGGLGECQARLFAREGAAVAVADVRARECEDLAGSIESEGGRALGVELDAADEASWERAVRETARGLGSPTVLVQNAGIYAREPIAEATLEQWERVMAVNAGGVFLGTRAVAPLMAAAGGGSIINVSSTSGIVGSRISAAYNPSKAAVRVLTKSTAIQYAAEGIRANSIHPGPADTAMLDEVYPTAELRADREGQVPLGRLASALDVAYAALFLASDESSYVTGAELVVDGGLTAL